MPGVIALLLSVSLLSLSSVANADEGKDPITEVDSVKLGNLIKFRLDLDQISTPNFKELKTLTTLDKLTIWRNFIPTPGHDWTNAGVYSRFYKAYFVMYRRSRQLSASCVFSIYNRPELKDRGIVYFENCDVREPDGRKAEVQSVAKFFEGFADTGWYPTVHIYDSYYLVSPRYTEWVLIRK